jgi:hypothetical protein
MRDNAVLKSEVALVPRRAVLPASFVGALKRGWKIISENTVLGADKRHRHGKVFLQMSGHVDRLVVSYTATIRQGCIFGKPQLLS